MRGLYLLAVCATLAFLSEGRYIDSECRHKSKGALIPHESDNHKYYVCKNGHKKEKNCPWLEDTQLCYNPDIETCDFNCYGSSTAASTVVPSTVEPSSVAPTTVEPASSEATTEEPASSAGTTEEPASSEGTTEEPASSEATTEEPASSAGTTEEPASSEGTTEEPASSEATTEEPASSEATTEEPSASAGTTEEPASSEGTTEEPASSEGTTEEPASSEATTEEPSASAPITVEPNTTYESTTSKVCPGTGFVKLPHKTNCKLYYVCEDGNQDIASCMDGQVFNPKLSNCDYPKNVPGCKKPVFY